MAPVLQLSGNVTCKRQAAHVVTAVAVLLALATAVQGSSWAGWTQSSGNAQKTGLFAGPLSAGSGIQWAFDSHNAVSFASLLTPDGSTAVFSDSGPRVWAVALPSSSQSLWTAIWHGVRSPDTRWEYTLQAQVSTVPALTSDGTGVLVGDQTGRMYCIDITDGSLVWSAPMPGSSGLASAVTVSSTGTVLVGDAGLRVYAVDEANGNVYWSCAATGAVLGAPAVDPSSSVMFFTSTDTYVYAVAMGSDSPCASETDAPCRDDVKTNRTGCSKWNVKLSTDQIKAGPTLDTDSRTLYVTTSGDQSLNGTLFGLNLDESYDLASVSALYAASRELTTGPGIVMPGVLAFGAADGMLHAVNVTTTPASVVWSHLSGGSTVASKPVSNGVHVAYGSTSDEVYVLDAATGAQLVQVDVGGSVVASPAVTSEGWVVIGDTSGILWCIGGSSPDFLLWRLVLGGVALVLVVATCVLVYCCCMRKRRARKPQSLLDMALIDDEAQRMAYGR